MSVPPPTSIRLDAVRARRGDADVLDGIDALFGAGAVTAIAGPNGSGKSTLLEVVAGVHPLSGGSVIGIRAGDVAFVPQRSEVPAHLPLTVAETVAMGRWRLRRAWQPLRRTDRAAVDAILELLGLTDLRDRPLDALSGGQRQRTLVGQGLAAEAPVLLLDEPTAGVDADSARVIDAALRTRAQEGAVVVHATHDILAIQSADAVLHLLAGRVTSTVDAASQPLR